MLVGAAESVGAVDRHEHVDPVRVGPGGHQTDLLRRQGAEHPGLTPAVRVILERGDRLVRGGAWLSHVKSDGQIGVRLDGPGDADLAEVEVLGDGREVRQLRGREGARRLGTDGVAVDHSVGHVGAVADAVDSRAKRGLAGGHVGRCELGHERLDVGVVVGGARHLRHHVPCPQLVGGALGEHLGHGGAADAEYLVLGVPDVHHQAEHVLVGPGAVEQVDVADDPLRGHVVDAVLECAQLLGVALADERDDVFVELIRQLLALPGLSDKVMDAVERPALEGGPRVLGRRDHVGVAEDPLAPAGGLDGVHDEPCRVVPDLCLQLRLPLVVDIGRCVDGAVDGLQHLVGEAERRYDAGVTEGLQHDAMEADSVVEDAPSLGLDGLLVDAGAEVG